VINSTWQQLQELQEQSDTQHLTRGVCFAGNHGDTFLQPAKPQEMHNCLVYAVILKTKAKGSLWDTFKDAPQKTKQKGNQDPSRQKE
jgi:hypothetical protein